MRSWVALTLAMVVLGGTACRAVAATTPEEMVRLGYKPVGKDFPVFLHPRTHEEHALARTERKVARGKVTHLDGTETLFVALYATIRGASRDSGPRGA